MSAKFSFDTAKVGDQVGVARMGSWDMHNEGIYEIMKINKMVCELERVSDSYGRTFSVKTGVEKGRDRFHSAVIETVEEQKQRAAVKQHRINVSNLWFNLSSAVSSKNLTEIEELTKALHIATGQQ